MKVTTFDPAGDLIIVDAVVSGPRGEAPLRLAIDTASGETVMSPDVTDQLGYGAHHGEHITRVRSAVGDEQGYTLRVSRFATLGFELENFRIHVFDLAEGFGIDGLVGLSFLRRFNYEIRSAEGRILVQPTST